MMRTSEPPHCTPSASFQFDGPRDLVGQFDPANHDHRLGRQFFIALETALGDRLPHRLLDLALPGDAECLEKLADTRIEAVLVHRSLLCVCGNGAAGSGYV